MTIKDAEYSLIGYFMSNHSINNEEFNKIFDGDSPESECEAAIFHGLENLEKRGFLTKYVGKSKSGETLITWILKTSLENNKQSVEIDGSIGFKIAEICNSFLENSKEHEGYLTDPLEIKDIDLDILISIINLYAENHLKNVVKKDVKK